MKIEGTAGVIQEFSYFVKDGGHYFEGFQLEWYISTVYHCRDILFWSETLNL